MAGGDFAFRWVLARRHGLGLNRFDLGRPGLRPRNLTGLLVLTQHNLGRGGHLLVGPRPGAVELPVAVDRREPLDAPILRLVGKQSNSGDRPLVADLV
jgi:hypothetical protein